MQSPQETLAFLVRQRPPLTLTDAALQSAAQGLPAYVRVSLLFERADQPPSVDVLAGTASKEARDAVLTHVACYWLPCLGERSVAAVHQQARKFLLPG